jgi:hypothetical protein
MVSHGIVNGRSAIRLAFVNPDFEESDVDQILKLIENAAAELSHS